MGAIHYDTDLRTNNLKMIKGLCSKVKRHAVQKFIILLIKAHDINKIQSSIGKQAKFEESIPGNEEFA